MRTPNLKLYSANRQYAPFLHPMHRLRRSRMMNQTEPNVELGGSFTLPGASMTLHPMGYGAMQLAGPQVWGPPRDRDAAVAVLREAVAVGVNHIDTADFYGPHVTNQIIRKALRPYPVRLGDCY